jgi:hypothetical protein
MTGRPGEELQRRLKVRTVRDDRLRRARLQREAQARQVLDTGMTVDELAQLQRDLKAAMYARRAV